MIQVLSAVVTDDVRHPVKMLSTEGRIEQVLKGRGLPLSFFTADCKTG